ncbi:TonB-dependent receptor [Alkalitalea saponilacus]|uniref:CarboxypepD_reg-like domain-containing protein n=1 Tax=Alkalitalea saponilacus TaxID=889453 RepID=A0A1T5HSK1_9BACT|nr:TonB-dependent receptor [Alkalitalea saponilacus]ASB47692.1 TonB-dependent receptor [Alkalitalea saponilacus]SKC23617.1 CarboxypepD_reg-like domain-containing protein [Alkalitalea saponilacus]
MKTPFKILVITILVGLVAQSVQSSSVISGRIYDADFSEPLPSATVVLLNPADSSLMAGVISNYDGEFHISGILPGNYLLEIGFIGFHSVSHLIDLSERDLNLGDIYLHAQTHEIGEALIVAERRRAGSNGVLTTYHVNNRMEKVSATGVDVLSLIPGVQIDLMQNLTIQGRQNIKVLVNNIERDLNFLRQLDASRILKVEVNMAPGAGYEAVTDGVINVILKERETGWNGHVHVEAPITQNEYYLFPNFGLNVGIGKFNFFTSYDGEFSGFDIEERSRHTASLDGLTRDFTSVQEVVQDYRSHRFHYGFDFYLNERNLFNFYAYTNPFSNEHDGNLLHRLTENGETLYSHDGSKRDNDRNNRSFYSLYYRHSFNSNHEISTDVTIFRFKGENQTWFEFDDADDFSNSVNPYQINYSMKIDHKIALNESLLLRSGFRHVRTEMKERQNDDFRYRENLLGVYSEISGQYGRFGFGSGIRMEERKVSEQTVGDYSDVDFFPSFRAGFTFENGHRLEMRYTRMISRPHIYQMNPQLMMHDPMFSSVGNPALKPSFSNNFQLEHSLGFGSGFFSSQLFFNHHSNFVGGYTELNSSGLLERNYLNLGGVEQYGIEMVAAVNLLNRVSISPYVKVYRNISESTGNIGRVTDMAVETAFSAAVELGKSTSASVMFQHNSPVTTFQNKYWHDALYFITLDQKIGKNLTAGLKSALPLSGTFAYHAFEINGNDFSSNASGNISLSELPLWFYARWQFGGGKNINRVGRDKEDFNNLPSKGF